MDKKQKRYKVPHFQATSLHLICGAKTLCNKQWDSASRMQSDDFNRLYCVLEGQAVIDGSKGRTGLKPGYVYLIPGQYKFRYACPEAMLLLWVHFQLDFLPGLDIFQRYEPESMYSASKTDVVNFKYMVSHLETSSPEIFIEVRALLLRLLKPFMPGNWGIIQPAPENVERLKPVLELLNNRYNQSFNLRETAKVVNMNPASMSDLFRRTFGSSPSRYLMDLRLRRTQNLLLTTDRRISDIAAECGFGDPLYFSRAFRKRYHLSPRKFRQKRGI